MVKHPGIQKNGDVIPCIQKFKEIREIIRAEVEKLLSLGIEIQPLENVMESTKNDV